MAPAVHAAKSSLVAAAMLLLTIPASRAASSFLLTSCSSPYAYFDVASLACLSCGIAGDQRAADNSSVNTGLFPSPLSCGCTSGYSTTAPSLGACDVGGGTGCPSPTCLDCVASGKSASLLQDGTCLPCGASTLGLDVSARECGCDVGVGNAGTNTGSFALVETAVTGAWLAEKACVACGTRGRVFYRQIGGWAADRYTCRYCADPHATLTATGDCVCDAGYRAAGVDGLFSGATITCLPQAAATAVSASYSEAAAILISFYSLQLTPSGGSTNALTAQSSKTFQHYYMPSAVQCVLAASGTPVAGCEVLANLCALQLYAPGATVCAFYTYLSSARAAAVHGFQSWPSTLPMLTYGTDSATSVMGDSTLARIMSFDALKESGTSDTLQFYLVSTALNGTFLGVQKLSSQLQYCGSSTASSTDTPAWLQFGHGYSASLTCDLKTLLSSDAAKTPVFYDLYVRDLAADEASLKLTPASGVQLPITIYPVPVAIVNYRAADGSNPNRNPSWTAESNDVYTRRFTLVDAASSVTTVGDGGVVLRYASSIRLSVRARRDGGAAAGRPNLLSPPLLIIEYKERLAASIASDGNAGSSASSGYSSDTVSFHVEYITDNADYGRTVLALAVSLGMLVFAVAIVRVTSWVRMNARTVFEAQLGLIHMGKTLQFLITSFAPAFFWFLWVMTLYWLVFFKLQSSVFCLLPGLRPEFTDNEYNTFTAALLAVFLCYIARILELMWYQCTVDLFFVDWEKPRGALVRTGQDHESGLGKAGVQQGLPGATVSGARFAPISVWRTLHVANEWAELQVQRRLQLPFVLLVLVCILEAGRVKYVATPQPDPYDLSDGEINPILQFGNNVFWFLVVACIQLAYTGLIGERYISENPSSVFIDVCTVSKVSLLIMDHKYHGYYIHGNAPHEHADAEMRELAEHLYEEATAMRLGRGLPGCPDPQCQTFELHVPALWRDMYDRVYRRLLDAESAAVESAVSLPGGRGGGLVGSPFGGGYHGGTNALAQGAMSPYGGAQHMQQAQFQGGAPGAPTSLMAMSSVAKAKERCRRMAAGFAALNTFVKGFIEETDPDYKRVWRDRTLLQQTFDMPPDMLSEAVVATAAAGGSTSNAGRVTYTMLDRTYRFERAIFRGAELDLLVFDMLVFCFTDYWQQSPTIAAVVTYIVAFALSTARRYLGDRNITYKTLIDNRFLH